MSELIRGERIKAHAEKSAKEGKGPETNPYPIGNDPRRHDAWLSYYYDHVNANERAALA